jgi:predicted dehydrogenase
VTSGGATSGGAASGVTSGGAASGVPGLRFGVLGTGFWARTVHAAALAEHPGAELVGIWGRDAARAAEVGAEFEVPGTSDLDALLEQVDAVAVAVPPDVQVDLAVRAAQAGRHLLLEKPVALSVAGADRVAEAVRAAGVASVVFFTDRFRPETATWLEQAGRTRVAGGSVVWLGSLAGTPFDASAWRHEHGALWDVGPHALALLTPALGPVAEVQAGGGLGDTVHLVLHHRSGAASTVTVSSTVAELAAGIEVSVHGDAGRLVLLPDREHPATDALRVAADELAAAALTGASHPCDVRFGRDVVAVLAAAARALGSGCRETVGT